MDSMADWISPLAERALSCFIADTTQCPSISTEIGHVYLVEHGSNLRFKNPVQRTAQITEWLKDLHLTEAILSDSASTIRTIFSSRSLNVYRETSENRTPIQQESVGCWVELLDFEIVIEYMTSIPDIHLFVEAFNLDRKPRMLSRAPEVIVDKQHISHLIKQLRVHMKENPDRRPQMSRDSDSDDSLQSQLAQCPHPRDVAAESTEAPDSQEAFGTQIQLAQMPPRQHSQSRPALIRSNQNLTADGNELLGFLKSWPLSVSSGTPQQKKRLMNAGFDNSFPASSSKSRHNEGKAGILEVADCNSTSQRGANRSRTRGPSAGQYSQPLRRDAFEIDSSVRPAIESEFSNSKETSASNVPSETNTEPKGRVHFGGEKDSEKTPHRQSEITKKQSQANSSLTSDRQSKPPVELTSSWVGHQRRTRIRRKTTRIPKDQEILLNDPNNWMPPDSGRRPAEGHVPLKLLQQWNEIISRRRLSNLNNSSENDQSGNDEPALPEISGSALHQETESEEGLYPWFSTPLNRDPPRPLLPVDSSPYHEYSVEQPVVVTPTLPPETNATIATTDTPVSQGSALDRARSLAREELSNNGHSSGSDAPKNGGKLLSQGEDNDSDMDISVSQALDFTSQEDDLTNSVDQAPTSGQFLSVSRDTEQAQVINTPTTELSRLRSRMSNETKMSQERSSLQRESPLGEKTSSPSRIANTYDNSEHDALSTTRSSIDRRGIQCNENENQNNPAIDNDEAELPTDNILINSQLFSELNSYSHPTGVGSSIHRDLSMGSVTETTAKSLGDIRTCFSGDISIQSDNDSSQDITTYPPNPLKRPIDVVKDNESSRSKRTKTFQDHNCDVSSNVPEKPGEFELDHKQKFSSPDMKIPVAGDIYRKFKRDYPIYMGDYIQFTRICAKLQALRTKGLMKRSFLWDDFVIHYVVDYPKYLNQCILAVEEPLQYVDYFSASFPKPIYKKRSLTACGLEAAAAQGTSTLDIVSIDSPSVSYVGTHTSFNDSLVHRLTVLQTRSSSAPSTDRSIKTDREDVIADGIEPGNDHDEAISEHHETASLELGNDEGTPRNTRTTAASTPIENITVATEYRND